MLGRVSALFIAAVLIAIGFGACERDALDVDTDSQATANAHSVNLDTILARARLAGMLHTGFMRYAHEQLRAEWLQTKVPLTRQASVRVVKKACIDFFRQHGLDVSECVRVDRITASQSGVTSFARSSSSTTEPYDQYLAAVEYAGSVAADLNDYLGMLADVEAAAVADPAMYSDTLDLELVLSVTSVAAESAIYADNEVESWGELYDPCHYMIIREEWCPPLYGTISLNRAGSPNTFQTQDLDRWGRAGWHILGADVGGAIGGGLIARALRAAVWQAAVAAAAGASVSQAIIEIIDAFYD